MKRLAPVIAALALLAAAPALAGSGPTHPSHHVSLTFLAGANPVVARSARYAPPVKGAGGSNVVAGATFNGYIAQSCWADTVQQFECAWRGVIVIIQLHKHAAPMIAHSASTRNDYVRVRLSLNWR